MSTKLTAAQVIAQGDYLQPDFEPSSLTVAQLLGVFGYHNVQYPSQYTKPKLVQLFNQEIKPKAKKYTKERIKRENSQASEDGITDGVTGRPLNEGKKPVRRTSRRLSKTPAVEEAEAEASAPPKRRRSSAEPSLGGPSKRRSVKPTEPVVVEESEPEEVPVVRKPGRPRKTATDAVPQTRRVSRPIAEDPESGWEDNNIFQSGGESSPIRPSPTRPRARKSLAARPAPKSRKSMSAPPQMSSPSPPKNKGKERERQSSVKPPESNFEPDLPAEVFRQHDDAASQSPFRQRLFARELSVISDVKEVEEPPSQEDHKFLGHTTDDANNEPAHELPVQSEDEEVESTKEEVDDENVFAVSQRIADGGQLVKRELEEDAPRPHWFLRFIFAAFVLSTAPVVYQYKRESSSIGFCDTGSNTNPILEGLRVHRAAVHSCNVENRTTLWPLPGPDGTSSVLSPIPTASATGASEDFQVSAASESAVALCPAPPLVPFAQANECTPCPKHATCTPNSVTCENGFILRPHPILALFPVPVTHKDANSALQTYERPSDFAAESDVSRIVYAAVSYALDGLFFGPVAFPPRCVEDPRRKRHIGVLGKAIESILASERGRRLCEGVGVGTPEGDEATEAQRWGIEVEKLRESIKEKTAPSMQNTLDDTFNEAVQQLLQWGGVFMGEDATGKRYLAHKTPVMSWECSLRVKTREAWSEWQRSILGTALSVLAVVYARHRQARKAVDDERVATLVTVALDCLRNQELAHHTDPVMAPRPYLSSLQLRDLVLQDVHSVGERKRLWSRVERIVEGNANVRTNLEEVEGGDEQRVWRWVGSAGRTLPPGTPGVKRLEYDFEERGEGGRIIA